MEYFVGAVITLVAIVVTRKLLSNVSMPQDRIQVVYSQSNVHELLRPWLPDHIKVDLPPSQLSKHYDKFFTKILVVDDQAYWIKENTFFTASIVDGDVDKDTTKPVDTMAMDKVQLDKMIFIIETLTKGNFDDYRNSK